MTIGHHGKYLRVDLSSGSWRIDCYTDQFRLQYLGGWGFIAYHLIRDLKPGVDPLGAENILIFANGALSGYPVGGSGRSAVGAKSPLTGGFGEADVGGYFGAELARTGFDAILFTGQAPEPVYLWLHDDEIELRPAGHLWGKQTAETQEIIRNEVGDGRARVAQIGPAGERLSPIAAIMHDVNRAAARGGLGAVMGSKRLKAVVVRGSAKVISADSKKVNEIARWYAGHFPNTWVKNLQVSGTAAGVVYHQMSGGLPTYNWQAGTFDGWETLTGDHMTDTILKQRDTCYACPVGCKRVVEKTDGAYPIDPQYGGPEYETVGVFGSMCGISDLEAVAYANQLCNAYGLDTISTGGTISWAMACFEKGLIDTEDTGGIELRYGNAAAMIQIVEQIGERKGFGRILSEGSRRAAKIIGKGSDLLTVEVKGQELPMHEPRVKFGLGVGYAVSPTGADHNHNFHDSDYTREEGISPLKAFGVKKPLPVEDLSLEKMRIAAIEIPWALLTNCIGFCLFIHQSYDRGKVVELLNAITGWDLTMDDLLLAGRRLYTLARIFNLREGFTRQDDRLPQVFYQSFSEGPSAGKSLSIDDFEHALSDFYSLMGWDPQTGIPEKQSLDDLGIGWAGQFLDGQGEKRGIDDS